MAVNFPSREIIKSLRTEFPVGARVEILKMNDVQAPPMGTLGTVTGIDDLGTVHVLWDNGSSLGVAYGEDKCRLVNFGKR